MTTDVYQVLITGLENMNYPKDELRPEVQLGPEGLDLESLALAELSIEIEESFDVTFEQEELESLATLTLGAFAAEIAARVEAKSNS